MHPTTSTAAPEWLTTAEAAAHAGYTADWIRKLIGAGSLPAHRRPGGVRPRWRIRRSELDAFLAGSTGPTTD